MLATIFIISGVVAVISAAAITVAPAGFSPSEPAQDAPQQVSTPVQDAPVAPQQTGTPAAQTAEHPAPAKTLSDASYSDPVTAREAITRHNIFAIDIYQQMAKDPAQNDKNIFFSPFSIYMAFSFLYEGARTETASEMERVFGFYSDTEARHEHVSQTIATINRDDSHATLETANALWLNMGFDPYDTYTDIVRDVYLADIETLDFRDDVGGSIERINGWAADKTNDKIPEVVYESTFDPVPAAILNNAIYFKGTWVKQFDPDNTRTDTFWKTNTAKVDADFMQNQAFFNYTESDGVQILQMPYEGDRLSMLVFLPLEKNNIGQLEKTLSAEAISAWQQQQQPTDVIVSMPKFKAETEYPLVEYLKNLGMPSAFDKHMADFSGIINLTTLDGNLYVSEAYQNAFVDVNEEGTEAAAVTTIVLMIEEEVPQPVKFTANHPFIFAIQDDESGTILFMGRLSDP